MIVNKEKVIQILDEIKPVKLVAATKYVDIEQIHNLEQLNCLYFGENRVQAFLDKYEKYHGKGHWHFIGTLQCNKVKYIIDKVELIHSVNTLKLIDEIEKQSIKHNKISHILLEVNIADEESKQGFDYHDIRIAMNKIMECKNIVVDGLMMMAPYIEPEDTRIYFKKTKQLLDELKKEYPSHPLNELSMGMSEDYHIAIEEGSTMVRIGRALFE